MKKKKHKKGKENQKPIKENPAQKDQNTPVEEDDFDFGGLKGPKDFKKQLGCGG